MSDYSKPLPTDDVEGNYVYKIIVISTIFPIIATIAVFLRFLSRWLKEVHLWWDDWAAFLAMIWSWAFYACVIMSLKYGNGRHVQVVSKEDQEMVLYWFFWYQLFYVMMPVTIKLSALFLYKRIFITPGFERAINVMMAIIVAWGTSSILLAILGCIPVSGFWTGQGKCINFHAWILGYGVPNIVFDVIVWCMPIPRIWIMNMPRSQKLTLTAIFMGGLVDCVLAVVRLSGSANSLGDPDFTYTWAPVIWWGLIHTCLGIVLVSMPTMRILLTKLRQILPCSPTARQKGDTTTMYYGRGGGGGEETGEKRGRRSGGGGRAGDSRDLPMANVFAAALKNKHVRTRELDVGLSLSGEHEQSLHSNTIAKALRGDGTASSSSNEERQQQEQHQQQQMPDWHRVYVRSDILVEESGPEVSENETV